MDGLSGSKRVTVEVTDESVALPPIRPRSVGGLIGHWVFILIGCGLVVFGVRDPQLAGAMVGTFLGIAMITLAGFSLAGQHRRPGQVRIRTVPDGIEFAPGIAAPALLLLAATSIVIVAVVALMGATTGIETGLPGTPGGGPVGRYGGVAVLAIAGGWGMVDAASRLLPPRGLRVSDQGVSWRRTLRRVDLAWDEIGEIGLVANRTQL